MEVHYSDATPLEERPGDTDGNTTFASPENVSMMSAWENTSFLAPYGGGPQTPAPPLYTLIFTTMFCMFEFFAGIIGNLLVAVVIWKNKDMRNSTNFFLVNLSVADLLVIVFCMPSALMELHARDYWYLGEFMCKLIPFLEHSVSHASALTILVISYERYFAICQPLKAQYICTTSRTLKLIAGVWVVALCASIPFFTIALHKDSQYRDGTPIKVCRQPLKMPWKRAYILVLMVVFFVIPVVVVAVLYSFISQKLFKEAICPEMRVDKRAMATLRSRRQVVVLLLAVVVLFLLCSLPWRAVTAWLTFADKTDVEKLGFEGYLSLVYFARVMLYFNSCINPIIYNMVSTKFRTAFKMALLCKRRTHQRSDTCTYSTVTTIQRNRASFHSSFSNSSLRTQDPNENFRVVTEPSGRRVASTQTFFHANDLDSDATSAKQLMVIRD